MTVALVFALGVLVGVLIGIAIDDALDVLKKEHFRMPFSTPAHRVMTVGLIVSILANMACGILLLLTRKSANDYYSCMGDWQQKAAIATKARADANAEVQQATDAIIRAVATQDRAGFQKALAAYVALRQRQDEQRKAHPIPDLPDRACGDATGVRR